VRQIVQSYADEAKTGHTHLRTSIWIVQHRLVFPHNVLDNALYRCTEEPSNVVVIDPAVTKVRGDGLQLLRLEVPPAFDSHDAISGHKKSPATDFEVVTGVSRCRYILEYKKTSPISA